MSDILIGARADGSHIPFNGDEHVAVSARTGTGKTQGVSIPNAFMFPGSLVVFDIKREIFDATAGHRAKRLGQKVFCYNPTSHDFRSHRWNPLDAIERTTFRRFTQIKQQAKLIIPDPAEQNNATAIFWQPAAQMALAGMLMLLAEMPEEPFTLRNAFTKFQRADGLGWIVQTIRQRRRIGRPFSENVVLALADYIGDGGRLTNDIRKSVTTNLEVWMDPGVDAATAASDFSLSNLRREPTSLYITVAPADIDRTRSLLRLLFGSVIAMNTDLTKAQDPSLTVPLLVILDEFASLGAMPALTRAAQYARGYGVRLVYIIQDKPQLRALYGATGAADVFNNVGAEVIFGLNDIRVAKEYEERAGDDTVPIDSSSRPRFNSVMSLSRHQVSQSVQRQPLIYDHELVQMPEDRQVIFKPGAEEPIARSFRIRAFSDPELSRLLLPPPVVPRLHIDIKADDGSMQLPDFGGVTGSSNPQSPPGWIAEKAIPNPPPDGDRRGGHVSPAPAWLAERAIPDPAPPEGDGRPAIEFVPLWIADKAVPPPIQAPEPRQDAQRPRGAVHPRPPLFPLFPAG